jgi:hypothetical protein
MTLILRIASRPTPWLAALWFAGGMASGLSAGELHLTVLDASTRQPMPARVHLRDAAGKPQRAGALPFWHDHFVCAGQATLELPAGGYSFEVERGPEFSSATGSLHLVGIETSHVTVTLKRIAHLAAEGWWSGETHVHRAPKDAELLMRAEDLHVGQFITWWNRANPWTNAPLPAPLPVKFDGNRFYHHLGGEDERDGGALLYLDLPKPVDVTGGARYYPSSLVFAKQARERGAAWLDAEKPFWWDFPLWVAHGVADTVGIANNHMHRSGVMDNEAWGRPRDRVQFHDPLGNGRWTQEIYYHALNCGLRLPPSAGSASGVLPNPVGYNRAYVHVEGELTNEKWREGLQAGRSFVSNGPLLRCRANGEFPGRVFQSDRPLEVRVEGKLDSRDPIAAVELVRNGRVERIRLPHRFTLPESGWFLVRAIADVTNTFRFASTAPWYVEVGGQPMKPRANDAQFFLDWSRERMAKLSSLTEVSADQKAELLQPWRDTETFWAGKISNTPPTLVTGEIHDAVNGRTVPARLYIRNERGGFHFAQSAAKNGSAVRYDRQSGFNKRAIERHTALSAHAFRAALPPGRYTFTVERGKEYHPTERVVEVGDAPVQLRLGLHRFADMAKRGWFSGDTHVHRDPAELGTLALAEDLNVVLPMTDWTIESDVPPSRSSRNIKGEFAAKPIVLDKTHVIYPRNTEYEIFQTAGKKHTLGAFLIVNHRERLDLPVLPWRRVAARARAEGALIDFEKHNWEWSAALAPIVRPDLFELANNHLWRTEFGVTNWAAPAPAWMNVGTGGRTEREWAHYGFQAYYALLNCGLNPRPTAGTAHGVHPVPLGYGRVYVHLDKEFSYDAWMRGLDAGRSFVTTGPLLLAEVEGERPGHHFAWKSDKPRIVTVKGKVFGPRVTGATVEIIVNGQVVKSTRLWPFLISRDITEKSFREKIEIPASGWLVVRCWAEPHGGKARFAHTAPWWFEKPGPPLRPRRVEVEWLAGRVREEIARNRPLLPAELLREYEEALAFYEGLFRDAR